MRLLDLIFSQIRKAVQKQGTNLGCPYQVYNFLVREDRVCIRSPGAQQHECKGGRCASKEEAPFTGPHKSHFRTRPRSRAEPRGTLVPGGKLSTPAAVISA